MGPKPPLNTVLDCFRDNIYSGKHDLLQSVLENFQSKNLQPQIGIELEFYLQQQGLPANADLTLQFISVLQSKIQKQNINFLTIEPEQGLGQIEIKTLPYLDIFQLCQDILKIKEITKETAHNSSNNLQVNFSSQPYQNDCGSSLQINFSMTRNGQYLFAKNDNEESPHLLQSIAALFAATKNMMLIFAPKKEDYLRFDLNLNRNLHSNKKYTAPVNMSWGYNNRTALIRIPATKKISERRLEFRLGGSDIDIYLASAFFLSAILQGMEQRGQPPLAIYGNAFDDKYDLEPLPNYDQAQQYLSDKIFLVLRGKKLD